MKMDRTGAYIKLLEAEASAYVQPYLVSSAAFFVCLVCIYTNLMEKFKLFPLKLEALKLHDAFAVTMI